MSQRSFSTDTERESLIPVAEDGYNPKNTSPVLWGRTLFVGVLFSVFAVCVCFALSLGNFWASCFFSLIAPFIICYSAPPVFSCMYKKCKGPFWKKTLVAVVFWGMLVAGTTGTVGSYFLRSYMYADQHKQIDYADAGSSSTPIQDFGVIKTFGSETDEKIRFKPQAVSGGRHLVWGFWPVCVAAIGADNSQTKVSYWAVGAGHCCAKQPMNCEFWNDASGGGVILHYKEVYAHVREAATDATASYNFDVNDNAQFVMFGDTKVIMDNMKYRSSVAIGGGFSFAVLLMFVRAIGGSY